MSKNAIALIDCNDREILLSFLTEHLDSKAAKNEMVSPYDDQLIGKMNFRFQGVEHAMFFTFAKAAEYPGMRFRGHKIIYVSLDVSESSSQALMEMCQYFGGYINHNDDLEVGFERIERTRPMTEEEELEEKQAREEQLEKEKQERQEREKQAKENNEERENRASKEKKHERNERKEKAERSEKTEQQHKNEHKSRNFHKGRYNKQNQHNKGNQQNKSQNQGNTQAKEN